MSRIIAGIGSRTTPESILKEMIEIGQWARENKVWVRSGKARGADQAFCRGAQEYCINYIPWKGFEKDFISRGRYFILPEKLSDEHYDMIHEFHPAPDRLSRGAFRLMARNCYQILGKGLTDPVAAVVCYTEQSLSPMGLPQWKGGTGFGCRLAQDWDIPILNMYDPQWDSEKTIKRLEEIFDGRE
jgi:hypothetical protein